MKFDAFFLLNVKVSKTHHKVNNGQNKREVTNDSTREWELLFDLHLQEQEEKVEGNDDVVEKCETYQTKHRARP